MKYTLANIKFTFAPKIISLVPEKKCQSLVWTIGGELNESCHLQQDRRNGRVRWESASGPPTSAPSSPPGWWSPSAPGWSSTSPAQAEWGRVLHTHSLQIPRDTLLGLVEPRVFTFNKLDVSIQGVPKKQSHRFKGHFRSLNGRKSKKVRKGTSPKI